MAPFLRAEDDSQDQRKGDHLTARPQSRLRLSMRVLVDFDEHVFDPVERSITYLIRMNTWPRFVAHLEKSANVSTTISRPFRFRS